MKKFLKLSLCLLAALAIAVPAAAQVDMSRLVVLGASVDSGFLNNCWVKGGQTDSWPAIIARQSGMDFQQPLLDLPGVGGCMILQNLAPTFTYAASTPKPLNATLARPYNNLAVPGYWASDAVNFKPKTQPAATAPSKEQLGWLTLRGLSGGTSALEQAASQKATFAIIGVFGNEALGAATSGTVIDGVTLPSAAVYAASYKTIVDTMKASQGGAGIGIAATLPDIPTIAYFTAVSPIIGVNPATGAPIYVLGPTGCPAGVPACPVPAGTLVPFPLAAMMKAGYGIPCAVAPTLPKCNNPLPDNGDPATGIPGLLYPSEVSLLRTRVAEYNAQINALAGAAGYKVFDTGALIAGMTTSGRNYGGATVNGSYLLGGFFSFDGVHPTPLGYAIVADDAISFINQNFNASLHRVDLSTYLFNGASTSGGIPGMIAMSQDDILNYGAAYWTEENLKAFASIFPVQREVLQVPGEGIVPVSEGRPVQIER
jgi:hypothetical protein